MAESAAGSAGGHSGDGPRADLTRGAGVDVAGGGIPGAWTRGKAGCFSPLSDRVPATASLATGGNRLFVTNDIPNYDKKRKTLARREADLRRLIERGNPPIIGQWNGYRTLQPGPCAYRAYAIPPRCSIATSASNTAASRMDRGADVRRSVVASIRSWGGVSFTENSISTNRISGGHGVRMKGEDRLPRKPRVTSAANTSHCTSPEGACQPLRMVSSRRTVVPPGEAQRRATAPLPRHRRHDPQAQGLHPIEAAEEEAHACGGAGHRRARELDRRGLAALVRQQIAAKED